MSLDLVAVRQNITQLALEAGEIILKYHNQGYKIEYKGTLDIVTEADKAAEKRIVSVLESAYPNHHIVGEEGGHMGAPKENAPYRWYIDPIDGTANYASKIPYFSISMALADDNDQPLVGVVYNPVTKEMYSAVRGGGATLNDQPIHVSDIDSLTQSMIAITISFDKAKSFEADLQKFLHFSKRVRGIRRFGSAALELCMVASGQLDAYWETMLNPWDFMAGMLIVQEAGGIVTDFEGNSSSNTLLSGAQVIGSNPHIHTDILAAMAEAVQSNA